MEQPIVTDLQARLIQLEAENAALRAASPQAHDRPSGERTGISPAGGQRRASWGRALLATVLIVLGSLIAPLAVVAAWANVQLTDTDRFVASYAHLAEDPAVQSLVTTQVVSAIDEQVDVTTLTTDVIDGVINLGTGPAATRALELLKGPAAQGLQSLMSTVVERFVASEAFTNVWASALRVSHTQVSGALQNDQDTAIDFGQDGSIGIQLAPIIEAAKDALLAQGIGLAASIPPVDRTIIVAQSDSLPTIQLAYGLTVAAGLWLPWIAILLLASGVVAARRRSRALIVASLALAFVMMLLLASFSLGRVFFDSALRSGPIGPAAGGALYESVVGAMRATTVATLVLAIVSACVAWFSGPFATPRRLRSAVNAGAGSLRAAAERRGISTGRVGTWLYSQRILLRVVIAVVGAAVVLLVRPLTPALTLWTLAVVVVVILVLEIVERPPMTEGPPPADGVTHDAFPSAPTTVRRATP